MLHKILLAIAIGLVSAQLYGSEAKVLAKPQIRKIDYELYEAVKKRNLKDVQKLLVQGASPDVEIESDLNSTALISATENNCVEEFRINSESKNRSAEFGNCDCIAILGALLEKSSDINKKSKHGHSPLGSAIWSQYNQIIKIHMLLDAGASINPPSWFGKTLLKHATLHGNMRIIRFLIKRGASLEVEDGNFTLLWDAVTVTDINALTAPKIYGKVITFLNAGVIPDWLFYHLAQKEKHKDMLNDVAVEEALKHCDQRRLAYKNTVVQQICDGIPTMVLDLANIIADYTITIVPARVPTGEEMQVIQPIVSKINQCKTMHDIEAAQKEFDYISGYTTGMVITEKLNEIQIAYIEDAVEECRIHIHKLMRAKQLEKSACHLM